MLSSYMGRKLQKWILLDMPFWKAVKSVKLLGTFFISWIYVQKIEEEGCIYVV